MKADETFELACRRDAETASAVLIWDYAEDKAHWIPLSQVESMHFDKTNNGSIVITKWIAQKKGLL
jgi:hypothetical protein